MTRISFKLSEQEWALILALKEAAKRVLLMAGMLDDQERKAQAAGQSMEEVKVTLEQTFSKLFVPRAQEAVQVLADFDLVLYEENFTPVEVPVVAEGMKGESEGCFMADPVSADKLRRWASLFEAERLTDRMDEFTIKHNETLRKLNKGVQPTYVRSLAASLRKETPSFAMDLEEDDEVGAFMVLTGEESPEVPMVPTPDEDFDLFRAAEGLDFEGITVMKRKREEVVAQKEIEQEQESSESSEEEERVEFHEPPTSRAVRARMNDLEQQLETMR